MKTAALIGIAAFACHGFTSATEKAIDLGAVQVTAEKQDAIPHPPVVAVVALIGGALLLLQNRKKAHPPRP